jgi:hypothetical protein
VNSRKWKGNHHKGGKNPSSSKLNDKRTTKFEMVNNVLYMGSLEQLTQEKILHDHPLPKLLRLEQPLLKDGPEKTGRGS